MFCPDAKEVVKAIQSDGEWAISPIIFEIVNEYENFENVNFSNIPMNRNEPAHPLAKPGGWGQPPKFSKNSF